MVGTKLTRANFIYLGMRKDGFKFSEEQIQKMLDDPNILDNSSAHICKAFHYYHDWYCQI